MKKLLAVILMFVFVVNILIQPVFAQTNASDWKKANGNAEIGFNSEGTKIALDYAFSYYYYKNKVDIRDFTVKVKLNAPVYNDSWGYFVMTIGGVGEYIDRKNAQNFVQLIPKSENSLQVDSQILYAGSGGIGQNLSTVKANISSSDLIIQGKMYDESYYQLIFNNGVTVIKYNIPANYNFIEDVNGIGCLGFGAIVNEPDKINNKKVSIVVKEINGVAMNVKDAETSSSPTTSTNNTSSDKTDSTTSDTSSDKNNSTTTNLNSDETNSTTDSINSDVTGGETTDAATDINNNTSKNNKKTNKNISQKNNAIIIFIMVLLLIVNIVIIAILLIKKKKTKISVEQSDDLEEPQE